MSEVARVVETLVSALIAGRSCRVTAVVVANQWMPSGVSIDHGAKLIKCCASGGVISATGPAGAQQYSTEELKVIADEAHRRGLKVATHCQATLP